jgi:hypothetical protein
MKSIERRVDLTLLLNEIADKEERGYDPEELVAERNDKLMDILCRDVEPIPF